MKRQFSAEGVVLKRFNYGEADRIVTIFTRVNGKITTLAKGVRKLNSKKKGSIEVGTNGIFYFTHTKHLPILTQASLINSHQRIHSSLVKTTQLFQLLEIIDRLTVEEQEYDEVYTLLQQTINILEVDGHKKTILLEQFRLILKALGFTYDKHFDELSLKDYIETLSERKLRSKSFLTPDIHSIE